MFFPFDIWRTQALESPETGMAVARLHVEAANHQGLVREFARWGPVLREVCTKLIALRDGRGDELLAAIHALVGGLHNRYAFSASEVEEQVRPLSGLIEEFREEWQRRLQRTPNACSDILGRYHGTLAQHYGFCGPEYLAEVEGHVRLAQEAFGNGRVPEKRADGVRGQLVFLDAFPEAPPSLKADIMNPHFHKYYGENQPPVDCEDPIPVKFLSVEPGTVFVFRVLAAPLAHPGEAEAEPVERNFGPEDEARVRAMFSTAFDELGFGGKTAVGYGRFQGLDGPARRSEPSPSAAPSSAQPSPTLSVPVPKKDPDARRQEDVAAFKSALPRPDALAGQIDSVLGAIRAKEDDETRKLCCQALLNLARSNKKKFNSALKDRKAWAVKLTELCAELGVAIS